MRIRLQNIKKPKTPGTARHWTESSIGRALLSFVGTGAFLVAGSSASRLMVMLLGLFAFLASAGTTLYLAGSDKDEAGWAAKLASDVANSEDVLVVADVLDEDELAEEEEVVAEQEVEEDDVLTTSDEPSEQQSMDFAALTMGTGGDALLASDDGGRR